MKGSNFRKVLGAKDYETAIFESHRQVASIWREVNTSGCLWERDEPRHLMLGGVPHADTAIIACGCTQRQGGVSGKPPHLPLHVTLNQQSDWPALLNFKNLR